MEREFPPMPSNSAPTFEDLSIDDGLTDLQKLVKYSKSEIALQRVVHAKLLSDVAKISTLEEIVEHITPIIEVFMTDNEIVIRQYLLEQLPLVAAVCIQKPNKSAGYDAMISYILPAINELLVDSTVQIRTAAVDALVKVCRLMKPEDLSTHVLTIILQLAHDEEREDIRMTASELLNLSADCLGQDLCRQFVIPEAVSLSEDPAFRVRRSVAINFSNICKVGGEEELFERLMPAFVALSKDDMYRVRRACADSLVSISNVVSNDIRVGVLCEIFWRLSGDPSNFVKQSVLQNSGMFISTLQGNFISSMVLNPYLCLKDDPIGEPDVDNELRFHCAYSFPGVFQAMGPSRWGELRDLYNNLVQSRDASIRQTLAASLHEIAKIFGENSKNVVESELATVFEDMIQDSNEDTQMATLKYLATFLKYLPEMSRISYLHVIHDIVHSANHLKWRLRYVLACQLSDLIDLPPKYEVFNTLEKLASMLVQDPVAQVRTAAYKGMAKLLLVVAAEANIIPGGPSFKPDYEADNAVLKQNLDNFNQVIWTINSLNVSERFDSRQSWTDLCQTFLSDPNFPQELFRAYFIDGILKLTLDPVVTVRRGVSVILTCWKAAGVDEPWPSTETIGENSLAVSTSEVVLDGIDRNDNNNSNNNNNNDDDKNDNNKNSNDNNNNNGNDSNSNSNSNIKLNNWAWLLRRPDIRQAVVRLSHDDKDIYDNMRKLAPYFPDINFESISCRGLKRPPGGTAPIPLYISSNDIDKLPSLSIDTELTECRDSAASLSSQSEGEMLAGSEKNKRRSGRFKDKPTIDISTVSRDQLANPIAGSESDSEINERYLQKSQLPVNQHVEFLYFDNSSNKANSPTQKASKKSSDFDE